MPTTVEIGANYTPRQWAIPAHKSKARRKVLWVHRRGGKGWFSLHEGLKSYAKRLDNPPPRMKTPRFHAWSVAPSFPQARQVENELDVFLPQGLRPSATNWDDSRGHSKSEHTFALLFPGGYGLWEIKSAHDPEALQTVGLDFLHVQECQDIPEAAFFKLLPTLRDQDRLSLSVWEGIPPDYPDHWFARLLAQAEDNTDGHSEAFKVTYLDNADLLPETVAEIESDQEVMLEREWLRMYMVELAVGSGSFLGDVDSCITAAPLLEEPEPGHKYVMGIDVAKKVDFTVMSIMDGCCRRLVWERRFGGMDWVVQEESIIQAYQDFRPKRIKMDSTGVGDPLYDRLLWRGLPVEPFLFTNESKYRLLIDFAVAIEKRHVSYPNVPIMLREMRAMRATKLPSGRSRVEAAGGGHDDYPISLALCYSLCDPAPDMALSGPLKSVSYMPMQEQAGGSRGWGANFLRNRRLKKVRARQEQMELEFQGPKRLV